ncbi:MAG TPA: DNA/RNA non-specific endonuclease [Pyrinomonadaceae bacterium]|nr:DNA/RNA non-specific endonuclease [Pyrinomonadaceae bacterium]
MIKENKVIGGGIIALIVIASIAFFCFWLVKKAGDRLTTPDNTTQTPSPESPQPAPPRVENIETAQRVYLALGNPSNASANTGNPNNYLMVNEAFAVSYNNSKGTPNWVAWRLSQSDFGTAERQNDFRPDTRLPKTFTMVRPADYTGSGFDRGHVCPSADRSSNPDLNSLTFLMTNMIPQTGDLNRNVWERLESYSRDLVKRGKVDLYIVAGVYGEKGKLKQKVSVPSNCWKVIVAVPQGADVSAINENTHVIAVDMPNVKGIASEDWRKFRTSVRSIEQKTGYNFLSALPQDLQEKLETRVDNK